MSNEENVNKILGALDNAQQAKPNDRFIHKMENMVLGYTRRGSKYPISGIAASLLFIISINIYAFNRLSHHPMLSKSSAVENFELIPIKSIYNE
jgi:hypothetical protein